MASLQLSTTKSISEKQSFISNKIISNPKIAEQNGRLWTVYHDMQLFEYVIKYNFNFYEIANRFQNLCNNYKKYEYSEDAIRLHWSFLHAMRLLGKPVDVDYYKEMKLRYDNKEKELSLKALHEEKIKTLSEEEDIKRMKEEMEKAQNERYALVGTKDNTNNKDNKKKEEEEKKKKEEEEKKKKEEEKNEDIKIENNIPLVKPQEKKIELAKDENEPEFIKALFSKKIPKEIQEKLEQDKGKYTDTHTTSSSPTKIPDSKKTELHENDEMLFPIKSTLSKEEDPDIAYQRIMNTQSLESQLKHTKNIDNYIEENSELKKQYDQLNTYCNFAVKSLNYIVTKGVIKEEDEEKDTNLDSKIITKTNERINELLLGPIIKKTQEEGFNLEEFNKKIEEEEKLMNSELTNYDNYMKTAPKDADAEMKLNKFKEHLFSSANKMSTEELLEKITDIINTTKMEEIANRNENEDENDNNNTNPNSNHPINHINRLNQLNQISNLHSNNDNNSEDLTNEAKTENTNPQTENIDLSVSNANNTIMSEYSSVEPKKYRHVYRGIVYYTDKPNEDRPPTQNKKGMNEYEEDDDDDDDYNK